MSNLITSSSDNPLVSVIIPVYNGEEFILDAVDSALMQRWKNLEVIVVDDGSTDSTYRLLLERAAVDSRLRVLQQANGGVARARNHALSAARGSLIAPLDADDLWEPSKIERQVHRMADAGDETAMVYSGWVWIDESGLVVDRSPRWEIEGRVFNALLEINFTGNASVPLFRRHALEEIGGFNPALADADAGGCEDWEVALRIARRYRVAAVPEALVGYRRRPGSMSTAFAQMWRSREQMVADLRRSGPAIPEIVLRRSERQYCLYLAGVAFWSGNYATAVRWGLRSGLRLPLAVLPYVLRLAARRIFLRLGAARSHPGERMRPGIPLPAALLPLPHIDYARIYGNRPQTIAHTLSGDETKEAPASTSVTKD